MRRTIIFAAISLFLLSACRRAPDLVLSDPDKEVDTNRTATSLVIRSGTSFGMCAGYCVKTMMVNGRAVTYVESGGGRGDSANYPTKTRTDSISSSELNCLLNAVDMDAFMKLDTIIGCPDCADGGAEWIEITKDGVTRRVTFEYGRTIPTIQRLVDRVRLLRGRFNDGAGNFIYQTWEWVQSSGGIAGVTLTPATTGYRQRSIYRSDGTYESYRNDTLVTATTFAITLKPIGGQQEAVITYGDTGIEQVMYLRGDTLELADQCADCFGHLYMKATTVCD